MDLIRVTPEFAEPFDRLVAAHVRDPPLTRRVCRDGDIS